MFIVFTTQSKNFFIYYVFTTQSNINKNLSQIKGSFDLQLGFISCLQRHTTIYTIIRVYQKPEGVPGQGLV
jgi:hypothetical protein